MKLRLPPPRRAAPSAPNSALLPCRLAPGLAAFALAAFALAALGSAPGALRAESLPPSLVFAAGNPNAVAVEQGGKRLVVNRDPADAGGPELVLLTHARRELAEAARPSVPGSELFAPAASRDFLEGSEERWQGWWEERFDCYRQQVTRLPTSDLPADRYLEDGETFAWAGLEFRFLATPGYTRDGGTYLVELDGKQVAFTGELILEGGRVSDLYSFQEEIPEARIGGYHGYLGRLAQWLRSLEALAAEAPDLLVPSRGEPIHCPLEAIEAAAELARSIYRNYLETNALHWYFGEERMGICAERVLGPAHGVVGMPFAEHVELPDWCHHIGTTKLLVSASGRGFVLDVGSPRALESLAELLEEGLVSGIDGIFATHAHNDHTAAIAEAAARFACPVYATPEVAPVLERPGDWFLPGVSPNAVPAVMVREDGETMAWEEFSFTFRHFPGQMLNHGALLVEKPGEDPVFFIGDSFSPSGIDDYCLMNRNLLREDSGYFLCFRILEALPGEPWLVNQHIPHRFRFDADEKRFLLERYRERAGMIARFTPWDDASFAVDERWAAFHPYGSEAQAGESVEISLRLWNHSTVARRYEIRPRGPFAADPPVATLELPPRSEGSATFSFAVPAGVAPGVRVFTADLTRDDGLVLPYWAEALLRVGAGGERKGR